MKRIDQTEEERAARKHRQRTIHNWKKQYGFSVPIELFDEFKRHKRYYTQLLILDKSLVQLITNADVPQEILEEIKQRKD